MRLRGFCSAPPCSPTYNRRKALMKKVHPDYIKKIIAAEHHDPFSVLGMHEAESGGKRALVVRAFLPEADKAFVVAGGKPPEEIPMSKIHNSGLFECLIKNKGRFIPYKIKTIAIKNHLGVALTGTCIVDVPLRSISSSL